MELHRCSRCERHRPLGDFPPSRSTNKGQWCRQCLREWYVERCGGMVERLCDGCGEVLEVTARRAAEPRFYCSRSCKSRAGNAAARLARLEAKPERNCFHCGVSIPKSKRADAGFCTEQCEQAAHNATRKAAWKIGEPQELVSRAYIIERDAGRCHRCRKVCDPGEIHLDHLVPLARGGTHSTDNLAVACAHCNLSRGARGEAQLLLVG